MKFLIFMTLLSAIMVIKSAHSMSIGNFLLNPLDDQLLTHGERKFHQPDLVHISVRRLDEMNGGTLEGKQIPVISDIERIKKVVEIIEFVGEKVGQLIDKIGDHEQEYYDERRAETTEYPQGIETQ